MTGPASPSPEAAATRDRSASPSPGAASARDRSASPLPEAAATRDRSASPAPHPRPCQPRRATGTHRQRLQRLVAFHLRDMDTTPHTTSFTAFRDAVPSSTTYPVGLTLLCELFPRIPFAAYFVATATWVRQAAPLESARLPVLRMQSKMPMFRVRNHLVSRDAQRYDLHIIVYGVPVARKRTIANALSASRSVLSTYSGSLIAYHDVDKGLHLEGQFPNWI